MSPRRILRPRDTQDHSRYLHRIALMVAILPIGDLLNDLESEYAAALAEVNGVEAAVDGDIGREVKIIRAFKLFQERLHGVAPSMRPKRFVWPPRS